MNYKSFEHMFNIDIFFDILFKAPSDDGGSPVTQYKVEMRDVDRRAWNDVGELNITTNWVVVNLAEDPNVGMISASCKETTVTVEKCGIEVGHEYVFRFTNYCFKVCFLCVF